VKLVLAALRRPVTVIAIALCAVLGRLGVWRGLLDLAAAAGDIQPFVTEVGQ
jgi:hypothetical protein